MYTVTLLRTANGSSSEKCDLRCMLQLRSLSLCCAI